MRETAAPKLLVGYYQCQQSLDKGGDGSSTTSEERGVTSTHRFGFPTPSAAAGAILLTYPSDRERYGDADRAIRSTASEDAIGPIDLTRAFQTRCPGWECLELLPDQHLSQERCAPVGITSSEAAGAHR